MDWGMNFLVVLGGLFHRFGRCPNHGNFLEEFIFQSAPKLIRATGSFGPSAGVTLVFESWSFSRKVNIPKCSKTRFSDPGPFWAALGGALSMAWGMK